MEVEIEKEKSYRFEAWISCLIAILIFGILGNVFAIISISYAKLKKTYHFHQSWRSSIIFFLNLILVDMVYCLFLLAKMIHGLSIYLKFDTDDVNEIECEFYILGIQTIANIGGWSIASIIFTQAIPKLR